MAVVLMVVGRTQPIRDAVLMDAEKLSLASGLYQCYVQMRLFGTRCHVFTMRNSKCAGQGIRLGA
jgi:hypothetical protein